MKIYEIPPTAKPRMTRRDKSPVAPRGYKGQEWPRPSVAKYWRFKNMVIANKVELPEDGAHVIFIIAMPKSWSIKEKQKMAGRFHKALGGPDLDNLLKGLGDAIYKNDAVISDVRVSKVWGYKGQIRIGKI